MIAVSCTMDEIANPEIADSGSSKFNVFHVYNDDMFDGRETKTFFRDEQFHIAWDYDDRITIFQKDTYASEWRFIDESGSPTGDLEKVEKEGFSAVEDISSYYGVYPYSEDTKIGINEVISYTLPTIQQYREHSFGRGSNVTVAKSQDNRLKFKNVGGYLCFKLWGDNVTVSSVILKANGGQALAGPSTITVDDEGIPHIEMASSGVSDEVRLYCGEVKLGSSADNYTEFWFVLPPVDFTKADGGFSLIVTTTDGKVFTQNAAIDLSIERNNIQKMAPLKVVPQSVPGINLKINKISSNAGGYGESVKKPDNSIFYNEAEYDPDSETFTITLPTVTDFSNLVLNYDLDANDVLIVDGKKIESGVTPIDASGPSDDKYRPASQPVTLTVCRGYVEKKFTLVARNTGLPVVRIITTGFTQADLDAMKKYKQGDVTIDQREWRPRDGETDASAKIIIEYPDGSIDTDVATQIKGRGNASWKYDKRPYALKFDSKANVLKLMKSGKSKKWVLLANWKDRTLLRNDAAFWLSKQTDLDFTVNGTFVELEFNGIHRGNYYFCEKVEIDNNRVAINGWDPEKDAGAAVTGGFLMEIDNNYDEDFRFKSAKFNLKYMFNDPDKDLSDDAVKYMTRRINNMETKIKAISNKDYSYRDSLDIDSAIWFMFVNELTGNGDFFNNDGGNSSSEWYGPHSTFLYKNKEIPNAEGVVPADLKKIYMGPVWDFDYHTFIYALKTTSWSGRVSTENRWNKWIGASNQNYYYYYLCKDPVFKSRMLELWEDYKNIVTSEAFSNYIDEMADYIRLSEGFNETMWGYKNSSQDQYQNGDNEMSFQEAVNELKRAYAAKLGWMDTEFSKTNFSF